MSTTHDLFIIGGGINGVGIARDAAGRGYSVALAEMDDLASGTSSWSSKLVHGGVRYLEHYEFLLVRKALKEREVLWASAPHIIAPMRFILPHHEGLRPAWFLRLGLFIYDHLGGRKLLPPTKTVDLANGIYGEPLKAMFKKGFQYSDCQVDDSRLVVLNAMDAAARGARIMTRTQVKSARRDSGKWYIETENSRTGAFETHVARMLINAAGPWVDEVLKGALGRNDAQNVRMVQGSHIVVPAMFDHDNAYIFQNADERIIFAIPWKDNTTLIGTTDRDYEGDPGDAVISDEEITYLCEAASEYFEKPVRREDIVHTYSGVRPLFDDGTAAAKEATRDYTFKSDGIEGTRGDPIAPLINIFGGKITTYRELGVKMMEEVGLRIGRKGQAWTHAAPLPGGDFAATGFDELVVATRTTYPFIEPDIVSRLCHTHGTNVAKVLAAAKSWGDLGEDFGHGLTEAELYYFVANEWARTAEDVLWRRTKLGLRFDEAQVARLEDWFNGHPD